MPSNESDAQAIRGAAPRGDRSNVVDACSDGLETCEDGRRLSELDSAWTDAHALALAENEYRSLLARRRQAEEVAECIALPELGQRLRLFTVPALIAIDGEVPETQVDYALACVADAAPGALAPGSPSCRHLASMKRFFRYDELVVVPLSAVHSALAGTRRDGGIATTLRRLPFRARPTPARRSAVYLRFVVGVVLSGAEGGNGELRGVRWNTLEDVTRAVLGGRFGTQVTASATYQPGFYRSLHHALRAYQAARLDAVLAAVAGRHGISALIGLGDGVGGRRARVALLRDRSSLAACMLQMPWDEGPTELYGRVAALLHSKGVSDVSVLDHATAADAVQLQTLATPF